MSSKDWMSRKRTEQLAMAKTWIEVMTEKSKAWEIPAAEITIMQGYAANADTLIREVMSADRNAVITARTNKAFDTLTDYMRFMKRRKLFSPPLTAADLVSLGLKPPRATHTPIPDPAGQANADVSYPGPNLLMLHLKPIEGTLNDSRADYGYRIYFGLLPPGGASQEQAAHPARYLMKAAISGDELPHSQFSRRKKVLMEFPAEDSGKSVYFAIRYENAKGGKGPWGPIFSAIIP